MIKRCSLSVLATLILLTGIMAADKRAAHFGEPFTDAEKVALEKVMSSVSEYSKKSVKIEGEIRDVCQSKGCWLVLTEGEHAMRVSFKDYGFFVPKDSAGKRVVVEGVVEEKTITELAARHYASESRDKVDPQSIKGPQRVITMVATGVEILQ